MKYTATANPGDIAQCLNGHDLYKVTRYISLGGTIDPSQFDPIGGAPVPQTGETIAPCHLCGMPWIASGTTGGLVMCSVKRKFEP